MAIFLLALLGIMALTASEKKPARPGEKGLFHLITGTDLRGYNPIPRQQIIDSYVFRTITESAEPTVFRIATGGGQLFGPQEGGAWFMANALHAAGFNIWVPPVQHEAFSDSWLLALPPGAPVPVGVVLLLSADLPFPAAPPGIT